MKIILLLALLLILNDEIFAQNGRSQQDKCEKAPTKSAKIICNQIHKWDSKARSLTRHSSAAFMPGINNGPKKLAAELSTISRNPYQCKDLECLCDYSSGTMQSASNCQLTNNKFLRKVVRKEYRTLTDDERSKFHGALRSLKASGEYDRLGRMHAYATESGGAHSGPAFLPWHREYMKRIEIALRMIDPDIALPYWDSTLDRKLPNPRDSVLWTDELLGSSDANGRITGGDFQDFVRFEGNGLFVRSIGKEGSTLDQAAIDFTLRQNQIETVLAYTAPRPGCRYQVDFDVLEYAHGSVHIFVGGDMFEPATATNDPSFFLHHSFIDLIWENYRTNKQNRHDRENAYPHDDPLCSSASHFRYSYMEPFTPLQNLDGLSNKYTDSLYEYAPRPSCQNSCGNSRFLFCVGSECLAKVQPGGKCHSNMANMCYNGVCMNDICVAQASEPKVIIRTTTASTSWLDPDEQCFNEHQCCMTWQLASECLRNREFMNLWCRASCGSCKPTTYSLLDGCDDRHDHCTGFTRKGECQRNALWMEENCRKSCNKCDQNRFSSCSGVQKDGRTTTAKAVEENQCESLGCYNKNVCCQYWSEMGRCRNDDFAHMLCECKVSCGLCAPRDYSYGSCADYHPMCQSWAAEKKCHSNEWMLENCRKSCDFCFDQSILRSICQFEESHLGIGKKR